MLVVENAPGDKTKCWLENKQRLAPGMAIAEAADKNITVVKPPFVSTSIERSHQIAHWVSTDCDLIECEICFIESPSHFWCRPRPCITDDIENELICSFRQLSQSEQIHLNHLQVDEYCVAPSEAGYKRAQILAFSYNRSGRRFANVLYIDHGRQGWVAINTLLVLPGKFVHFARQAILCILHGVAPVREMWSGDAIENFRQFCSSDDLYLRLMENSNIQGEHIHQNKLSVHLVKKMVDDKEVSIHQELLQVCGSSVIISFNDPFVLKHFTQVNPPDNPFWWQMKGLKYLCKGEKDCNSKDCNSNDVDAHRIEKGFFDYSGRTNRRIYANNVRRGFDIHTAMFTLQDGFLNGRVSAVLSPDEFYFVSFNSNEREQKEAEHKFHLFTNELTSFYSDTSNCQPVPHYLLRRPSAIGVCKLNPINGFKSELFYRCRVVRSPVYEEIDDEQGKRFDLKLVVVFVDLGCVEMMKPASEVFLLDKRFCNLPEHVIKCGLFSTRPISSQLGEGNWPAESVAEFRVLCQVGSDMKLKILNEECDRFDVVLFAPNASVDRMVINNEMVKMSKAQSDVHWPSFVKDELLKLCQYL